MDNVKDDKYYAKLILENISAIRRYISNKNYNQFMEDEKLIDAVLFRFIQMIENIKNISIEFKNEHKDIPWGDIAGFRNGIVHNYGKADYKVIYDTAKNDLPDLEKVINKII